MNIILKVQYLVNTEVKWKRPIQMKNYLRTKEECRYDNEILCPFYEHILDGFC